ncbi:CG5568 [Drosophila busckii]|uniref:CG5568 n=1 Tax=Drosophila busckii TaxID=30019 RepID=A0A0M4EG29_DROBS|nr:4-coumarate--CoA ligase 1 [Drosophila busckii]ALC43302.1 CG5568 [Drosophila busckii]
MPFRPANSYDADNKVWSGARQKLHFAADLSIGQIIFQEMRRHPNLVAQISPTENTRLTREELLLNSMRVASYLRQLGLQQSDIVGIIGRNTTHMFAVVYGCFFNGIAFHSLNMTYEQSTIEKLFNITKPRVIFCDGDEYEKVKSATVALNVKIVTMRNHPSGALTIEEILKTPIEQNFQPAQLEQGNNQTLAILCSSGTTGIPKAVTVANSRRSINDNSQLTTADVQFTHSTLDWLSGLTVAITSGVYSTTRIIIDTPYDPAYFLRLIEEYKLTWVVQTSSQLAMTTNCAEFAASNWQSMRCYFYGGGTCSVQALQTLRSHLGRDCLHLIYGFTEAGAVVAVNWHYDEKPNSCGRLANGIQVKILDEQGVALGPNETGEVCIYHGEYWAGYYNNPEETRQLRDSQLWYHSGDLGYMDDDGFLFILERKKNMLKYQNIMYYPHEIEDTIAKMPGVSEVCVFGVWNPLAGDEAAAAVVRQQGAKIQAEDVVNYVKEHTSASYKHLHGGALIMDELQHSANGKTNRIATKAYFLKVKGIKE